MSDAEEIDGGGDPLVFVRKEFFEGSLVTAVFHEWDGDWQYLTGHDFDPDQMERFHQSHLFEADPTLLEIADMPPGVWASRDTREGPWCVAVLDDDDE